MNTAFIPLTIRKKVIFFIKPMSWHGEKIISLLIIERFIFLFTCGQDSMFGIYGDDIEKKFDAADFSAKGNNIHLS